MKPAFTSVLTFVVSIDNAVDGIGAEDFGHCVVYYNIVGIT